MSKKVYLSPTMKVADIEAATILANSVNDVNGGGSDIDYGGGGSGPARSKDFGVWDDYEE